MRYRGTLGGLVLLVSILGARPATAQTEEELRAARKLFREAIRDLEEGRYATCLDKFQHVQAVKDTVNVRYNIARCLEELGRVASAHAMFEATIALAAGDEHRATKNEAMRRASLLVKRIPHLTVELRPVGDTEVRVDDYPWSAPGRTMAVDPGRHVVTVTLAGHERFRETVLLAEGQHATVSVPPEVLTPDPEPVVIEAPKTGPAAMPPKQPPPRSKTPWVLTTAAGGALVAASAALFYAFAANRAAISDQCPAGRCPSAEAMSEAAALKSRGEALWISGLGAGAVGLGALGLGVWQLTRSDTTPVRVLPHVGQHGGSVVLGGTF